MDAGVSDLSCHHMKDIEATEGDAVVVICNVGDAETALRRMATREQVLGYTSRNDASEEQRSIQDYSWNSTDLWHSRMLFHDLYLYLS
jgi:hypothetical protein